MEFRSLASSSHGNAYIVSDSDTRILIECGVTRKKLQKLSGFHITDFAGVLVSHEHMDHAKAVQDLIKDGLTLYMSQGTADALDAEAVEIIRHGEQFAIGSLDIVPFSTYHDAREPLGFLIRSRADGDTLVFATDTVNIGYRFPGLNILAIESNYAIDILERCERMPEKVRYRIQNSHMEIGTLLRYLEKADLRACRKIYLLHLSDATSHEGNFIYKVRRVVPETVQVEACGKEG